MFIIRRILLYFIPGILLFISNEKFKIQFSEDAKKDSAIKLVLFCLSFITSCTIVPFILETDKKRVQDLSKSVKTLLGSLRKEVSMELSKSFRVNNGSRNHAVNDLKLNIRVFVPKRRSFNDIIKKRRYFMLKNHDGLHTREIEKLSFCVAPTESAQGLIGQVYAQKCVRYDFDLAKNHTDESYNLGEHQIDATRYCNFAIAAPIFKDDTGKVICIITFDSEVKVVGYDTKWEDTIRTYNKIIHKVQKSIKN